MESDTSSKRSIDDVDTNGHPDASPKRPRSSTPPDADVPMTDGQDTSGTDQPPKSTPRKRGRPPKNRTPGDTPTPRAKRVTRTPTKAQAASSPATPTGRPSLMGGADRSARRKSARALIEQVVGDGASDQDDDDVDDDDDRLAREIYESSDDDEAAAAATPGEAATSTATTPEAASATTPKKRGGRRPRARSPTPPRDLPPHEQYFVHNKPGRPKTSDRTLKGLTMLTHDEYFAWLRDAPDRHAGDVRYLEGLHAESFPQWAFELAQGLGVCLYGLGSKRALLRRFARFLARHPGSGTGSTSVAAPPTVVVNGYAPSTTMRDVLTTVAAALNLRVPSTTPATMLHALLGHLSSLPGSSSGNGYPALTLVVNSIDAPPLRRPAHQSMLARLASHPRVRLVCSADTPDFPLLWDVGLRSALSLAFHDATTLAPLTAEIDVVDAVHDLLGRNARRVNGRDGVAFVLRSLPDNARNLFQLLVGEVLIAMDEDEAAAPEDVGVEYRIVYNKAVEEFICSSEMAFRTLLKEYVFPFLLTAYARTLLSATRSLNSLVLTRPDCRFHDHQIITSKKDALGTELLSVPFAKDELEAILEDLMG